MKIGRLRERVISVVHRGHCLRSIESSLYESPESIGGKKPVVVFLPAGLKCSAGPGRIFVGYARALAEEGFICYRFDPHGIGNSDGELAPGSTRELWSRIEQGCFIDDLAVFAAQVRRQNPGRKIVVCGLCGGAVTAALFAGRHGALVDGVVSINIEPFLSAVTPSSSADKTSNEINMVMRRYAVKLFSPAAWARLLSLESDVKGILHSSKLFLLQRLRRGKRGMDEFENINRSLVEALRRMGQEGIRHLLLFSEHSSCWHKFQDTLFPYLMNSNRSSPYGEVRIVRNANHELLAGEWRNEALAHIRVWLDSEFERR